MRPGTNTKLVVRAVRGKGRCVFAAEDIPAGTRVLSDPVIVVPGHEAELTDQSVIGRYVFEWNDDEDVCVVLGLGSLINHGLPENVALHSNYEQLTMDFVALTDIKAGEELVYDYGHDSEDLADYYGIRGEEPGAASIRSIASD